LLPQRSKHSRELVITPKASTSILCIQPVHAFPDQVTWHWQKKVEEVEEGGARTAFVARGNQGTPQLRLFYRVNPRVTYNQPVYPPRDQVPRRRHWLKRVGEGEGDYLIATGHLSAPATLETRDIYLSSVCIL